MKDNEGDVPQYSVENSHPAIVSLEVFDMVQAKMNRRKAAPNRFSGTGMSARRILCGPCGGYYGAKVRHSADPYHRTIYQRNNKSKSSEKRTTPHLDEETMQRLFVSAINSNVVLKLR